jgi:hypothetical protein
MSTSNPYGDKKVEKHVQEIASRTDEARQFFNFNETEKVVQDYACTRKLATGRLYVTQNNVGFRSALPKMVESFPLRRVKAMEKVKLASIKMTTDDGKEYEYGGFTQRDEAFVIIQHLWQNVRSVVSLPCSSLTLLFAGSLLHTGGYEIRRSAKVPTNH